VWQLKTRGKWTRSCRNSKLLSFCRYEERNPFKTGTEKEKGRSENTQTSCHTEPATCRDDDDNGCRRDVVKPRATVVSRKRGEKRRASRRKRRKTKRTVPTRSVILFTRLGGVYGHQDEPLQHISSRQGKILDVWPFFSSARVFHFNVFKETNVRKYYIGNICHKLCENCFKFISKLTFCVYGVHLFFSVWFFSFLAIDLGTISMNSCYYPLITYYWTVPLILHHLYLVRKSTSSKIADTKVSGF
jgi:hypothetical protein